MHKFLETYELQKLTQKEIENLKRTITSQEIGSPIKNLPIMKSPDPDDFTGKVPKSLIKE